MTRKKGTKGEIVSLSLVPASARVFGAPQQRRRWFRSTNLFLLLSTAAFYSVDLAMAMKAHEGGDQRWKLSVKVIVNEAAMVLGFEPAASFLLPLCCYQILNAGFKIHDLRSQLPPASDLDGAAFNLHDPLLLSHH